MLVSIASLDAVIKTPRLLYDLSLSARTPSLNKTLYPYLTVSLRRSRKASAGTKRDKFVCFCQYEESNLDSSSGSGVSYHWITQAVCRVSRMRTDTSISQCKESNLDISIWQWSILNHWITLAILITLAGFEPTTGGSEGHCSVPLSYRVWEGKLGCKP